MSTNTSRDSLMGRVVEAQNRFCANMTKRFNLMQGRMLNEKEFCIKKSIFDELGQSFADDLRQKIILPHTKSLLQVRNTVSGVKSGFLEEATAYINRKTERFDESIRSLFRKTMLKQSELYDQTVFSTKEIEQSAEQFGSQVKKFILQYNESILCLLGLEGVSQAQCSCSLLEETNSSSDYVVQDVFGRIILNPLDEYYSVEDIVSDVDLQRLVFPRTFCAATLNVLRTYVIGIEKYQRLNAGIVTSIQRLCGKEQISRDDCRNYLNGPDLERYLMSYCLHILNALQDEERRESFLQSINIELSQKRPGLEYCFTEKHLRMLLNSWAQYVFDKVEDLEKRKKTKQILRTFIPDHVARFEARSRFIAV